MICNFNQQNKKLNRQMHKTSQAWLLKQQKRDKKLTKTHLKFFNSRHLINLNQSQHQLSNIFPIHINQNFSQQIEQINVIQRQINKQIKITQITSQEQSKILKQAKLDQIGDYGNNQNAISYQWMWKNYLFQANKIRRNKQKEMEKIRVLSVEQKEKKILKQTTSLISYMLQESQKKINQKQDKLQQLKAHIKNYYEISHNVYINYMQLKNRINSLQKKHKQFLTELKANQKQRNTMLSHKRNEKVKKNQYEYLDVNLNDQAVKQIIQKKAKLNLELDLNFQVQQRKKINTAKKQFQQQKNSILQQYNQAQKKIQNYKKKIYQGQKQQQKVQEQKDRLQYERSYFLRMLLKNPQHLLDGVIWTLKKMIQYGIKPKINDLSDELDEQGKNFILKQYEKLKKQIKIQPRRPFKRKINTTRNKQTKQQNRTRVKSLADFKNSFSIDTKEKQTTPKMNNEVSRGFFNFQSNKLFRGKRDVHIRKKSGSVKQLRFDFETSRRDSQFMIGTERSSVNSYNINNNIEQNKNTNQSFKNITKNNKVKTIYDETKNFIKDWVNHEGWKCKTSRTMSEPKENKISQKYIQQEKTRLKRKYYKIGAANTKYESIVKTLFGVEELNKKRQRLKTTR